jgi:GNAT superfamily N-acetyltransferase
MMTEFYSESPYTVNRRRAAEAFSQLLADDQLGQVWFIQADSNNVGYVVVTFCYSMEYGGPTAIVDDLFVQPAFRGMGLGKAALAEVLRLCASRGVRAVHVETGKHNAAALAVYRQAGFVDTDRMHLAVGLADPTHAP